MEKGFLEFDKKNYKAALYHFLIAAETGDENAQLNAAYLLDNSIIF